MNVDDLISAAKRNRTGPMEVDALSPSSLSELLRVALGELLADIEYEANPKSGTAIAARMLATIITGADEIAEKAVQS